MFNRSLHDAFHDGVKTAKAALLRVLGRDSWERVVEDLAAQASGPQGCNSTGE